MGRWLIPTVCLALVAAVLTVAIGVFVATSEPARRPPVGGSCSVTVPTRQVSPEARSTRDAFNYGGAPLRALLYWPNGRLAAGVLPDGSAMAVINADGSIYAKVGWWRGLPGRLTIRGRRLDGKASPLRARVPGGYGSSGFQPSGLTFPTVGCWRVTGTVGTAELSFVVKVTKIRARR